MRGVWRIYIERGMWEMRVRDGESNASKVLS